MEQLPPHIAQLETPAGNNQPTIYSILPTAAARNLRYERKSLSLEQESYAFYRLLLSTWTMSNVVHLGYYYPWSLYIANSSGAFKTLSSYRDTGPV